MIRNNPAGLAGPAFDGQGNQLVNSITGTATAAVPAGAGNAVVSAAPGRLCRAVVTTAGTGSGSVLIYDNATAPSGVVIGVIPATIAVGTMYSFEMPAAAGITVANVANGPAFTLSYA